LAEADAAPKVAKKAGGPPGFLKDCFGKKWKYPINLKKIIQYLAMSVHFLQSKYEHALHSVELYL